MNEILSTRAKQLESSATMAVSAKAQALKSKGLDIISLSVGEPDFDTPDFIKEAAIKAINQGMTKYTDVDGTPALRQAITQKLERDNALSYQPDEIIVTSGAKQAIYNAALATLNPGDEVIIPTPYWVSYPPIAQMAEAKSVILETTISQRFKITPPQLEKAITPKTRWLILNSPSNPSGMAYTLDELKALGHVLIKHPNILIISDDIYEYILWGQPKFVNIINACPSLRDRTIVINGVSKCYAMTGWRLGYAAAAKPIIAGLKKIQSQSTTCACSISQAASVAGLQKDRSHFDYLKEAYEKRHHLVHKALNQMNGVQCAPADGAFYLFPDVSKVIQRLGLKSDVELSTHLLETAHVAVVPGTAFGSPGYIRLSCATSEALLQKAIDRMGPVLSQA